MQNKKNSLFLSASEKLVSLFERLCAGSAFLQWLSCGYRRMQGGIENRAWPGNDGISGRIVKGSRTCRICLYEREQSLFLTWLRRLGEFLLQSSTSSWGLFFMLYGGFILLGGQFLIGKTAGGTFAFLLPLLTVACAVPLLVSSKSLSYTVCHSAFLGGFLFGFCGILREEWSIEETGRGHPILAMVCAAVLAIGRLLLPWFYPLLYGVCFLILLLVFLVPELWMLIFLVSFPFFSLFSHATVVLFLVASLLVGAWGWKVLCGRRIAEITFCNFFIIAFGVLCFFGGITGESGTTVWNGLCLLLLLLLFLPFQSLLIRPLWRRRAIAALQFGGAACALLGIGQYFLTDLELKWVDMTHFSNLGGRVSATFSNPNMLAVYLLSVIPFSFCEILDRDRSIRARLLFLISFSLQGICLVLTWTRGAWLGALCASGMFFLLYSRRSRAWLLLTPLLVAPALPLLPQNVLYRFASITSFADSSVRYRLYTWRGVLRLISNYPWGIGVGEATFSQIYSRFAISGTEGVMHTHHLFLQILTELGIFGLLLFCCVLYGLLLCIAHGISHLPQRPRGESLAGACALIGILVMGLFDNVWYHRGLFALFWILFAFVEAPLIRERSEERKWYGI